MKASKTKCIHYYLVSGKVTFFFQEEIEKGEARTIELNAILKSPVNQVNQQRLEKSQQAVQMRLFELLGEERVKAGVKVTDVYFQNISHLGYMTEAEFHARDGLSTQVNSPSLPEGLQ